MALKIVIWNANGLAQHHMELEAFFEHHNVNVLLQNTFHIKKLQAMYEYICFFINYPK